MLSCLIVLVTHDTLGWVTIALVWLGHVTVTGAELFQSAAHWGFLSELSDPDRRGEYQGAAHLGGTLGGVWAPARLHLPRDGLGQRRLADHRGDRGGRDPRHASDRAGGRALPAHATAGQAPPACLNPPRGHLR